MIAKVHVDDCDVAAAWWSAPHPDPVSAVRAIVTSKVVRMLEA
jgi:hypothetical protein